MRESPLERPVDRANITLIAAERGNLFLDIQKQQYRAVGYGLCEKHLKGEGREVEGVGMVGNLFGYPDETVPGRWIRPGPPLP